MKRVTRASLYADTWLCQQVKGDGTSSAQSRACQNIFNHYWAFAKEVFKTDGNRNTVEPKNFLSSFHSIFNVSFY